MLTIITVYVDPKKGNEQHGERSFWRWEEEGARYAEAFWKGVFRHIRQPTRRVMLTDAPHLFEGWPVQVVPLVNVGTGWWSKLEAFRPEVSDGKCWYSDLDNVLLGDVSEYLALDAKPLVMLEDRYYPGMANGSNILFDAHHPVVRALWTEYEQSPRAIEREFAKWPHATDQAYIAHRARRAGLTIPYAQSLLPEGYFLSGRDELEKGADWSQCRMIFGAGVPKPHESSHPAYAEWRGSTMARAIH
jgi:hypothetical protein